MSSVQPIRVFYSYAWECNRDTVLLGELEGHLKPLEGLIEGWHAGQVKPGEIITEQVAIHQEQAQLILLLVSIDLLNSHKDEIDRAMDMCKLRRGRAIPILLRAVNLHGNPLSELKYLPTGGKPVAKWKNRDEAWMQISQAVQQAALEQKNLREENPQEGIQFIITVNAPPDAATWTEVAKLLDQLAKILPKNAQFTLQQFRAGSLQLCFSGSHQTYRNIRNLWKQGTLIELGGYSIRSVRKSSGLLRHIILGMAMAMRMLLMPMGHRLKVIATALLSTLREFRIGLALGRSGIVNANDSLGPGSMVLLAGNRPLRIFCGYLHEDRSFAQDLERHVINLSREGIVNFWPCELINSGGDWRRQIEQGLSEADVILLLISADFINSDFSQGTELQRARRLHEAGRTQIIPIIVRPVHWQQTWIGTLQTLPLNGKPISQRNDADLAWREVALCINLISRERRSKRIT